MESVVSLCSRKGVDGTFASWKPGFHLCFALLTPHWVNTTKDGSWWQGDGCRQPHPYLCSRELSFTTLLEMRDYYNNFGICAFIVLLCKCPEILKWSH